MFDRELELVFDIPEDPDLDEPMRITSDLNGNQGKNCKHSNDGQMNLYESTQGMILSQSTELICTRTASSYCENFLTTFQARFWKQTINGSENWVPISYDFSQDHVW